MWITSLVVSLFLVGELPYVDEKCAWAFACQETVYQLEYQGQVISDPYTDLTLEECLELKENLSAQTAPFTEAECRAIMVEREES